MKIRVKQLENADLAQAGAVYAASWRYSHAEICSAAFLEAHTAQVMAQRLDAARREGRMVLLARADDAAAGVAVIDTERREVAQLYVQPCFFATSVAQMLMEAALAHLGEGEITLTVMNSNARARRFYEKCGFVFTGEEKVINAQRGLSELHYVKK